MNTGWQVRLGAPTALGMQGAPAAGAGVGAQGQAAFSDHRVFMGRRREPLYFQQGFKQLGDLQPGTRDSVLRGELKF